MVCRVSELRYKELINVTDGSRVVEELEPVVLDAPVYVKKSLRQKALDDSYADDLAPLARPVKSVAEGFVLPYTATVALPRGVDSLGVKAMVSEDGCGECSGLDTLDVATVVRGLLPLRLGAGGQTLHFLQGLQGPQLILDLVRQFHGLF